MKKRKIQPWFEGIPSSTLSVITYVSQSLDARCFLPSVLVWDWAKDGCSYLFRPPTVGVNTVVCNKNPAWVGTGLPSLFLWVSRVCCKHASWHCPGIVQTLPVLR